MNDTRKYSIKEKFDVLPHIERMDKIKKSCQRMAISMDHLRKIWSYKITDTSEAKPSQLQILSEELGCSIEELITSIEVEELG